MEAVFVKNEEKLPSNAKVEIILKEKNECLSLLITSNLVPQSPTLLIDAQKQLELLYPNQYEFVNTTKDGVLKLTLHLNPSTLNHQ